MSIARMKNVLAGCVGCDEPVWSFDTIMGICPACLKRAAETATRRSEMRIGDRAAERLDRMYRSAVANGTVADKIEAEDLAEIMLGCGIEPPSYGRKP